MEVSGDNFMTGMSAWLPEMVLLEDSGGDWSAYEAALYRWFKEDFVDSRPQWPKKRVALKRMPMEKGKEATFWHFISEGSNEASRTIDIRRCERIRWPRPIMDHFEDRRPTVEAAILWWKTQRRGEDRFVLALPDFSYIFIVADRGEYVLPWTAYCVEQKYRRKKYQKEFEKYWQMQNG
jgi:hypothetical protein